MAHLTTVAMGLRYLLLNQLLFLRQAGYAVTGISADGPELAALHEAGIPHLRVPMTRRPLAPLADLAAFWRLYRLFRRERFTIVHTHNPKPTFYGQIAARLAGVPVVVNTLHGFYFHQGTHPVLRRLFIWMEALAARCADVILSQNREDIETAIAEGICTPAKIKFLGNGIDLDRFHGRVSPAERALTRERLGLAPRHKVVGFVGRMVAEKGLPELMEAVARLRGELPDLRLLVIGPCDPDKPDSLTPARLAAGPAGDITACLGLRHDLPELYSAMDVCALPSHREGFPRVPMEASAMGVPCVVTDVRGCREAVEPGRNGLLVPARDPAALATALKRVLTEPELATRMAEEGRNLARERFDERQVFEIVRREYARLLDRKGLLRPPEERLATR